MRSKDMRSIAGGIIGIVGGAATLVFMFYLGAAYVLAGTIFDIGMGSESGGGGWLTYVQAIVLAICLMGGALGLAGGILALVLSNVIGSVLEYVAAAPMLITVFFMPTHPFPYIMVALLLIAGSLGLVLKSPIGEEVTDDIKDVPDGNGK